MNITARDQEDRRQELRRWAAGDRRAEGPATGAPPLLRAARSLAEVLPPSFWRQQSERWRSVSRTLSHRQKLILKMHAEGRSTAEIAVRTAYGNDYIRKFIARHERDYPKGETD